MPDTTANLGYGKQSEATIDKANIAMRAMPWYQEQMRAWGQDPGHPTLNKEQSQQLLRQAQTNGYVVDEGDMEIDNHGNFNPKGHKLRNTLIVAGLAAATIATMGAAGAFAGAGGGLSGATAGLGTAASSGTALGGMATLPALGGGMAGLAAPVAAGAGGALATGSKFASLLGGIGKTGGALSNSGVDANGNPINGPQNAAWSNKEDQLAKNRYLDTSLNQAGVNTDRTALQNMMRAGIIGNLPTTGQPLDVGGYALPSLTPSAQGSTFAKSMQDQLAARMATNKPLTLSGIAAPTQEELDARAKALDAAGIGRGANSTLTGIGNTINTGVRYAQLGKNIYDVGKGLFR